MIQLDLQVAAVTADILAGRPVVYTTFLAYDEVAHHSGSSARTRWRCCAGSTARSTTIAAAVPHAPRPYRLVVLSDHGQSQGATFLQRYGEALEDIVAPPRRGRGARRGRAQRRGPRLASTRASTELATRDTATGHAVRTAAGKRLDEPEPDEAIPEVSVMASGNLGLITFPRDAGPGDAASRSRPSGPG